jgi:2-dehydro-3-deoxygalactonokinase
VSADGNVIGEVHEPSGVRALLSSWRAADGPARESVFADFLRAQLLVLARNDAGLLAGAEVVISGMASSSVGWRELPYARTPLDLDGSNLRHESFDLGIDDSSKARVHMISGVRTDTDVMRGEETEILGAFADGSYAQIAQNGIVVLPGTHSKHVRLCDCQLASFQTYMTGELFDVLSTHSLLRASVETPKGGQALPWNEPAAHVAFAAGVAHVSAEGLAASLFQTRARTVLQGVSPGENRWFLSGLLIGDELMGLASQEEKLPILLAAAEPLRSAYQLALETIGLANRLTVVSSTEMAHASVRGHRAFLRRCGTEEGDRRAQ